MATVTSAAIQEFADTALKKPTYNKNCFIAGVAEHLVFFSIAYELKYEFYRLPAEAALYSKMAVKSLHVK